MQTLLFSTQIAASPEQVWKSLWESENYQAWTSVFCEGSHYKTDSFTEGSRIHLLAPNGEGMYSILDKIIENQFLAFRHLGVMKDFEEVPPNDETQAWENAIESYELKAEHNGTGLYVRVDTLPEYVNHMNQTFPRALAKLKEMAESRTPPFVPA